MDLEEFLVACDRQSPGSIMILNEGDQADELDNIVDSDGNRTLRDESC